MRMASRNTELSLGELPPLPSGWRWGRVEDAATKERNAIVDGPFGSNLKLSDYIEPPGVPVLTTANLRGDYSPTSVRYISEDKFRELKRSEVRGGDILVAKIGSCGLTGVYPQGMPSAIIPANLLKMTVHPDFSRKFIYYYLNSSIFSRFLKAITTATAQPAFNVSKFRILPLPVVGKLVQDAIVAEIEKQFTRLEAGIAALRRVQANLKRYRAAVLKAACEGSLVPTEAEFARRKGRAYESANQLLARILTERRKKWTGRGKCNEPAAPDTTNLQSLPEGWTWASVDQIADVDLGKMLDKNKHQAGRRLAYLRNINVRWDRVDTDDVLEMFFEDDQLQRYGLRTGDVLVCEGGEPGRAAVWDGRVPSMMYQKAIHRVRFFGPFHAHYLVFLLEFLAKTGRLERWFTGSTIKHFTRESFVSLPVPLPPLTEQSRILAEVERLLSMIEEHETVVSSSLRGATRLRQSILQQAFSGH